MFSEKRTIYTINHYWIDNFIQFRQLLYRIIERFLPLGYTIEGLRVKRITENNVIIIYIMILRLPLIINH